MFPLRDDRPTNTAPIVTTLLMVACILVYLHWAMLDGFSGDYFMNRYGVVPARPRLLPLFTSMFLHAGFFHVVGNMLFLWAFGKSLEDAMGHTKFLAFYISCGVIAALVQVAANFYSRTPMVGASGAIAGVMGAYMLKFPRANIRTLIFVFLVFIVDIPAVFILLYWFVIQIFSGYGSVAHTQVAEGGVAWFAHIGGFIAGMVLVKTMGTRNRYYPRRDIYW